MPSGARMSDHHSPPDAPTAEELRAACVAAGISDVEVSVRRRAEYSSDASLYRVVPAAVLYPKVADEVVAAMSVARQHGIPITPRGGGTSVAGNAIGPGLIVDTSRYMRRIRSIDPDDSTAVVEPGVVLSGLQAAAAPHGLRFGPDPSTSDRCTLGGMIGNDACGPHALRFGRTSDNVQALDILTGTGERLLATSLDATAGVSLPDLVATINANEMSIRSEFGRFARQVSGYPLHRLLPEQGRDLAKALVGTEGTCVFVLEATVSLVTVPASTALLVLGYPGIATAADDVLALLPHRPFAIEGMDARIVDAVRSRKVGAAIPDLPAGGAWMLVELEGSNAREIEALASVIVADSSALDHRFVSDPGQAGAIWKIRKDGAGLSSRSPAGKPAHPGWEDAAVPPARLGSYLREFDALMIEHGLTGMPYGHFGDGCMHVRLDLPLTAPDGLARFRRFLDEAADLVVQYGGSMSGEHGDGRARSALLPKMYSPHALKLMASFKRTFDPHGLLNPGVVVDPDPVDERVRPLSVQPKTGLAFTYPHDGGDFTAAVQRCVGIGACRADTTATGGVMCPSYLATRDEKDSTRGRARVLQEMVRGGLVTGGWRSSEVDEALDLCLACKACASDCPAGVDMATYKAEVLHQSYRGRLRPRTHYALGRLPMWLRLAGVTPRVTNWIGSRGPLRRLLQRMGGMDPRRPLPQLADRPFRRSHEARSRTRLRDETVPQETALLWVDTFTDRFRPQVASAAIHVLEDAGYRVVVPKRAGCCALTWISTGQLDTARRILDRTVHGLASAVVDGVKIVGLEPSCTAVLRSDARDLLGTNHAAAAKVARNTYTLAEALTARQPDWKPPRLDGLHVLAQPHCHHHAVMGWQADHALLTSAGASVQQLGGCCGLAGDFGVERGHYEVSVAVAETALLPAVRSMPSETVVVADGFSCRLQLEDLADQPSSHLAETLAAALGDQRAKSD